MISDSIISLFTLIFRGCKTGEGHFQFLTQQGREILECVKLQTQKLARLRQHLQHDERHRRPSLDSVPCTRSSENETVDSLTSNSFSWWPLLCGYIPAATLGSQSVMSLHPNNTRIEQKTAEVCFGIRMSSGLLFILVFLASHAASSGCITLHICSGGRFQNPADKTDISISLSLRLLNSSHVRKTSKIWPWFDSDDVAHCATKFNLSTKLNWSDNIHV